VLRDGSQAGAIDETLAKVKRAVIMPPFQATDMDIAAIWQTDAVIE
jgi:hypothetical protein